MKFKIDTLNGFQIMPTEHLRDKNLSIKAKGLLCIMFSLPNNWDYSMKGLCKITNTGITAIRNIIGELELNGYLTREQIRENGKFEYIYHIYFSPKKVNPMKNCTGLKRFQTYINKK